MSARARWRGAALTIACVLLGAAARNAHASSGGGFDLTWKRVASGGTTTASGGTFTMSATIAQHEPGVMTGGDFSLAGGFWHAGVTTVGVSDPAPAAGAHFALRGFVANPTSLSDLRVSYSLASGGPATLELLDLGGRRVAFAAPGGGSTGTIALRPTTRLAPGLYWLRLTQESRSATRRAVLLP